MDRIQSKSQTQSYALNVNEAEEQKDSSGRRKTGDGRGLPLDVLARQRLPSKLTVFSAGKDRKETCERRHKAVDDDTESKDVSPSSAADKSNPSAPQKLNFDELHQTLRAKGLLRRNWNREPCTSAQPEQDLDRLFAEDVEDIHDEANPFGTFGEYKE
ncbi:MULTISPECIES: hypothetical protein [unclassified Caballeronia]|uniref:hypothetical protein n=1 Tax=unclassified Caballeronia TaxID=2646786 RepID=UPI002027B4BD|nr:MULTISPECIES: hypothetical protein [unclassified Caballeronia]